jgi:hypothetical protein
MTKVVESKVWRATGRVAPNFANSVDSWSSIPSSFRIRGNLRNLRIKIPVLAGPLQLTRGFRRLNSRNYRYFPPLA